MYNKISSISLVVLGVLLFLIFQEPKVKDISFSVTQIFGIIIMSIGCIWVFGSLMNSMAEASYQIRRFKEISQLQRKLEIAKEFKEKLIIEFKGILTIQFPQFEMDLFTKFSLSNEKDKDALLAICPKVESGTSFIKYVENISGAMNKILEIENCINSKLEDISYYNESPWLWFRRPAPTYVKNLLKDFEENPLGK